MLRVPSGMIGTGKKFDLKVEILRESSLPFDRGTVKAERVDDGTTILVTWTIEDDKVTTLNLQYREEGDWWTPVTNATGLNSTVEPEFTVVNVKADKIYRFRMEMWREGESIPVYVYSEEVPTSGQRGYGGLRIEYLEAICYSVLGVLVLLIILCVCCCFKCKTCKRSNGPNRVEMSQTRSYADRGPNPVVVQDNTRSCHMMSVEDDPFIKAHFGPQASVMTTNGKKKNTDSGVNFGYLSQAYPARGPQRNFNTLPPYHEPPSFEKAVRQSGRKPKTRKSTGDLTGQSPYNTGGPGQGGHSNRRPGELDVNLAYPARRTVPIVLGNF